MTDKTLTAPTLIIDDIDRPRDGNYRNLNYVPWYARMRFAERLAYLDWIIARREAEVEMWRTEARQKEIAEGATTFFLCDLVNGEPGERLQRVQTRRRIELTDREPLETWGYSFALEKVTLTLRQIYLNHLDSPRWKDRIRIRKMVSVDWCCEHPDCQRHATDCHHRYYNTIGFEENTDLEALCRDHHEIRHRKNPRLTRALWSG